MDAIPRLQAWLFGCLVLAAGCNQGPAIRPDDPSPGARHLTLPRQVEPRLTATPFHAPCERTCPDERSLCMVTCAGGSRPSPTLSQRLVSFGDEPDTCRSSPDAEALCLLIDRTSRDDTDRAIAMLEERHAEHPTAERASDLGAAYLIRAQRFDQPIDIMRGWERILESKDLDPKGEEPWFNEAVVCTALQFAHCVERATHTLHRLAPDSAWTHELENRAVSTPGTSENFTSRPSQLRSALEGQLPSWGNATLGGDNDAAQKALDRLRATAASLSDAGASFLADVVGDLEKATQQDPTGRTLAEAARILGQLANGEIAPELRRATLEQTRDALSRTGSHLATWLSLQLARLDYFGHDHDQLFERLASLREASSNDHQLIHAQALWLRAAALSQQRRFLLAFEVYEEVLARFEALGDHSSQARVKSGLADLDFVTGRHAAGWHRRLPALRTVEQLEPSSQHFVLTEAGIAARQLGLRRVATEFQLRAADAAVASGVPGNVALSYRFLADDHLEAGDASGARALLVRAREALEEILETDQQQTIAILVHELEGRVALTQDPQQAITAFSHAIDLAAALGSPFPRVPLLAQRADAWLAAGDTVRANADLEAAVADLEQGWLEALSAATDRDRVGHQDIWGKYLDQGRAVFDTLIRLLVEVGRGDDALVVAERARARDLLAVFEQSGNQTLLPTSRAALAALRQRLPEQATILAYWMLADRVIIWRIDRTRITTLVSPIDRPRLERRIDGLIRGLSDATLAQVRVEHALSDLHHALISPVEPFLEDESLLLIVPDGPLHAVPFAALRREGADYLVQHHPIAIAPSVTLAAALQRHDTAKNQATPVTVLAIGPTLNAIPALEARFPRLEALPGARYEAERVAEIYPRSSLLLGADATPEAFAAAVGQHQVVHFAGHAVATSTDSYLILAGREQDPQNAVVSPPDLASFSFDQTRVVVLSACSSNGGHPLGSLGVSRLVRPLLGAGVPSIVGSLWDVRDRSVPTLMGIFHQQLERGSGPAEALRAAQRYMIDQEALSLHAVAAWAPFQVVGNAY